MRAQKKLGGYPSHDDTGSLHALLERRQDGHLVVQHLLSDQLLAPSGRGLLRSPFPMLPQNLPPSGTAAL